MTKAEWAPGELRHDDEGGRFALEGVLADIVQEMGADVGGQVVHVERLPARRPAYAALSMPLPEALQRSLAMMGVGELYTHQVEALERARQGENVVVVTSTSSGKTLCYNLPVLEAILNDRSAQALYIYPINALVNDQLKALFKMNLALGADAVGVAKYTGAVYGAQRREVRARNPHILLTNPEMVHLSFLLWHNQWETMWRHLRYIVLDEVHTYRGVFGANMAQLLRRMVRMAQHYGSDPQFLCGSATIANPRELVEALTGRPFAVVDRDGAGRGRRYFVLWNPPLVGETDSNVRRSYAQESVDLLLRCLRADLNTIVFTRARRLTESMLRMSQTAIEEEPSQALKAQISSYRAGYLAEEREEIETKLKLGEIRGIITTNALEMGIDIGGLDSAIIAGYPGTIMSTWQQAGRAGRRHRDALIFLVASQNPLDQYYMNHPQEFFSQPHERATVDLHNQHIRLKHLLCAAKELPFGAEEMAHLPADTRELLEAMLRAGLLEQGDDGEGGQCLKYPQDRRDVHLQVSLRAASQEVYRIVEEGREGSGAEIGTIEPPNAFREAHPGAIYQHGGEDYRVIHFDRQRKVITVREEPAPNYTRSSSALHVTIEATRAQRTLNLGGLPVVVMLGDVLVQETVHSYQERQLGSDALVKRVNLDYPLVMRLHTTAMWLALPPELRAIAEGATGQPLEGGEEGGLDRLAAGLHAVQHLLTGIMPLLVMCDPRDVGGYDHPGHPGVGAPTVFLYDAYEGGIGLAEVAYQRAEELLRFAHDTVARCGCRSGCPSCIQSGTCRLRNENLDKGAARSILAALVDVQKGQGKASEAKPEALAERMGLVVPSEGLLLSRQRAIEELLARTARGTLAAHRLSPAERPMRELQFHKGDQVFHTTFGRGEVLSSRFRAGRELVTVRFTRRRGSVKEVDASTGALQKIG
ncbi:MAG: DEAD/DEAH box helicase [Chloroflexi bacterium]|nr:DEAD/DEAH box helicase [Chloroflexota bacterium]